MFRYKIGLYSALSGALWGCGISTLTSNLSISSYPIWHTLSGAITGYFLGVLITDWHKHNRLVKAFHSILGLYLATILFGINAGLIHWLHSIFEEPYSFLVVFEGPLIYAWGLTFTGLFVALWPLAYANHELISRLTRT